MKKRGSSRVSRRQHHHSSGKNNETIRTFNKLMLVVILALVLIVVGIFSYSYVNVDDVSLSPSGGKTLHSKDVSVSWSLCKFSSGFCNCAPSRLCVNSNTVRTTSTQCVVNTIYCNSRQYCQYGSCIDKK